MTSIVTAPSLQLTVMKMAPASTFILVLLGLAAASKGSEQPCGLFAVPGANVTVPLEYKLQDQDRLKWKKGSSIIFDKSGDSPIIGKEGDISENGSLILKKVSKTDENLYGPEVYDNNGKNQGTFEKIQLCVVAAVKKPTLMTECTTERVTFTCSHVQTEDVEIKWFENGNVLPKESRKTLVRKFAEVQNTKIYCQVSNKASSEKSNDLEASCNGVVLLLIVLIVVCCIRNRRRRRMHMRDETEFRLNHASAEPPNPTPTPSSSTLLFLVSGSRTSTASSRPATPDLARTALDSSGRELLRPPTATRRPPPTNRSGTKSSQSERRGGAPSLPQPRKKGPRTQQH